MRDHQQKDRRNECNCCNPKPGALLSEWIHLFARSLAAIDSICKASMAAKHRLVRMDYKAPGWLAGGFCFDRGRA
jgi:hypothetical protein